ncbi:MAG: hypothetical protein J0653_03895, partial [Deltaproteobacteria bacterium]|nr:hypothetical protein [Deltaproteobacteria bacterium]
MEDYLVSFCRQGMKDYLVVKNFKEKTGIPTCQLISMLGGELASSHNKNDSFKCGTYEVRDYSHVEIVWKVISAMDTAGKVWGRTKDSNGWGCGYGKVDKKNTDTHSSIGKTKKPG